MGNSNTSDDKGSVPSHTLTQTRMQARDDGGEENQHAAHSSTPVSPVLRLYRHALECIFGMLTLGDLARILAVSRSWSAAVRSMKPIGASMNAFRRLPSIPSIVASPLMRHLAAIHIQQPGACWTPLNNESLGLLAQHAPNLRSLWCKLLLTPNEPLTLPARLQSLQLQLGIGYTATEINGVLRSLSALQSLAELKLIVESFAEETSVEFRILAACPALSDLSLDNSRTGNASDGQMEQIRSSLGHLQRCDAGFLRSNQLARLLQPPVTARWRDIGLVVWDERTGELLLRLPTLTRLNLVCEDTAHVEFLPQLTQLKSLNLECTHGAVFAADALLASLGLCVGLAELNISYGFKSAHWSALFAKLTRIKKLTVRGGQLDTLRCFAEGPITQSLEDLTLNALTLLPSELPYLSALRHLRTLDLDDCFSPCLDGASIDGLSPPTPLLPALTALSYLGRTADNKLVSYERHGSPYEWMQARLAQ